MKKFFTNGMIACGVLILALIFVIICAGGLTILFLIPLLLAGRCEHAVVGGRKPEPISDFLITHDPEAKTITNTPLGDIYLDSTNTDDKYKLMVEEIYKDHNTDHSFLYKILKPRAEFAQRPDPPQSQINEYMTLRTLTNNYPRSFHLHGENSHLIKQIEFTPSQSTNPSLQDLIDMVTRYTIILNIRDLTKEESDRALDAISKFNSGSLTSPTMTVKLYEGDDYETTTCYRKRSDLESPLKTLHWGQRKLLLSEIDFFNRAAQDIGVEKFKNEKITVLYPGSAHGDHLMILMELYPNITLYLWDPARYNNVLYLAEFSRRNMPIPDHIKPTDYEQKMADKYTGRIFINMELSNSDFSQYHKNSSTNNIPKNYETQHGFFLDSSIDYFHKHRQKTRDTSTILFVSDIRLYPNIEIHSFLHSNNIMDRHNPILNYFKEQSASKDYHRDMDLQKNWFLNSKSDYGLFKFKITLPTTSPSNLFAEYLDGDIVIQAWAPISTTETRLFVKPKRRPTAYYNIHRYNESMKYANSVLRLHNVADTTLKTLNIKLLEDQTTMGDIWTDFLTSDKIGLDTVLETHILYDYLLMHKKEISRTDLSLIISDITQTLINKTDQTGILRYMPQPEKFHNSRGKRSSGSVSLETQKKIFEFRKKYHNRFDARLDYNNSAYDNVICSIR